MTVLVTAAILTALLFIPGLMDIGAYGHARAEAQTAADAAALAAAQEISAGAERKSVAEKAGEYAALNGAEIIGMSGSEQFVVITVKKHNDLRFVGSLGIKAPDPRARAKAEIENVTDTDF